MVDENKNIEDIYETKITKRITNKDDKVEETTKNEKPIPNDLRYKNALNLKGEVYTIINGRNINILTKNTIERIFNLMGKNIDKYYPYINYTTYSIEVVDTVLLTTLSDQIFSDAENKKLPSLMDISSGNFIIVENKIQFVLNEEAKKEEEEKKKEEEERKKKEEEEEEERKKKEAEEEEERKKKEAEEEEERKRKEAEEEEERKRKEAENSQTEKPLLEDIITSNNGRDDTEVETLRNKQDDEDKIKEEEERKKREAEEEERRKREAEEEERKRKEAEEEENRKRKEAEENEKKRKEAEEKKKSKKQEEKKKKEEEEKRKKKEEDERRKKEEEKKKKLEEDKRKREEEKRKKEEEKRKKEDKRKREEEEKRRKKEEEKRKKEEEERERRKKEEDSNNNKKRYKKISQDKVIKKVKKKNPPSDNQNSNTRSGGGFYYGGGYGGYSQSDIFNYTTHYTGNRPIIQTEQKECLNCHKLFNLPYNEPNKKICSNCVSLISSNKNKPNKDPKYEQVSAREYFELNKDRYFAPEDKNKIRDSSLKNRKVNKLNLDLPICSKCKKGYNPKINKRFYFCNNCNDYICGNCSKAHYLQFPDHKCSQSNNKNDNNDNDDYDSKNYVRTEYNDIIRNKLEPITMCMSCGVEKKEFPNKNFIECPTCKKTFCDSCSVKHYRLNQTHTQPTSNLNNTNIEYKIPKNDEKCKICGIIHRNVPMRIFYDCNICKGCICFLCKKTHDLKFYNHRLINSRRYENKTPGQNINNNNLNNNVNDNNLADNNQKIQKKEEIKKGLYTLYGEPNCFMCKMKFEEFHFCNKCYRLYCSQCNLNYHKCNF